jgi:hypothetical protein
MAMIGEPTWDIPIMGVELVTALHKKIGDCVITPLTVDYPPDIWREVYFVPEKFEDAIKLLVEDIVRQKIYIFVELEIPHIFQVAESLSKVHVTTGHGISVRITKEWRWDIKKDAERDHVWSVDYAGWSKDEVIK